LKIGGDEIPEGEVTSFTSAVKAKEDETIVFSWVVWPSKEVRDAGWEAMMEDPRMSPKPIQCHLMESDLFMAALILFWTSGWLALIAPNKLGFIGWLD